MFFPPATGLEPVTLLTASETSPFACCALPWILSPKPARGLDGNPKALLALWSASLAALLAFESAFNAMFLALLRLAPCARSLAVFLAERSALWAASLAWSNGLLAKGLGKLKPEGLGACIERR
jgi:hypothetical protein